jgi:uncharacterized membrane protein (DUF4010 family)
METHADAVSSLSYVSHWPFVPVLTRLGLAVAIGLFIGLEREHRGKNGVRTFALTALLGCLGGLMGDLFSGIVMGFVAITAAWMNWRQIMLQKQLALTTSTALTIVGFAGILCGQGHIFTPVVVGVVTAALLAWKQPISGFVSGLSDTVLWRRYPEQASAGTIPSLSLESPFKLSAALKFRLIFWPSMSSAGWPNVILGRRVFTSSASPEACFRVLLLSLRRQR